MRLEQKWYKVRPLAVFEDISILDKLNWEWIVDRCHRQKFHASMHIYIYMIQTWQVWDRQLEYMLSWYTCWLVLLSELVRTLLAIFTMFQVLWMWIFVNGNGHPKWFSDTGPSTYEESMKSSKYLISMDLINYCSRCLFTSFWVTDCKEPDANSVTTIVTEY